MKNLVLVLLLIIAAFVIPDCNSWGRGRRRCSHRLDCVLSDWTNGSCSKTCGWGYRYHLRHVQYKASCGGTPCPAANSSQRKRTSLCYVRCCPVNCLWSWNSWSLCQGCGTSHQTRTMRITQHGRCGGLMCLTGRNQTRSCNTGV